MLLSPFRRFLKPITGFLRGISHPRKKPSSPPRSEIGAYVNRIISDAVLFNEIPSPTPREEARADFIFGRLSEFGYADPEVDEHGNLFISVPGWGKDSRSALLFADMRCDEYSPVESLAKLEKERVVGRGIAENSLGVSALLVLGEYLARNQIQFPQTVMLLFTAFDTGYREIQPLEHFLRTRADRLVFGVNIRGLGLGRVEEQPLGMYQLVVRTRTPERDVIGKEPGASAITVLANIAHRLGSIRWDSENRTFLNVAHIEAGMGFGWYAAEGAMDMELFSADRDSLEMTRAAVTATITKLAGEAGAAVDVTVKTFFPPGDPHMNGRLNSALKTVHARLKIKSLPVSLPDQAAVLNSLGVPAVSLGITIGHKSFTEEYVELRPIESGFRQLFAFLEESMRTDTEVRG
jgi:tripeptide aminopeptidase